MFHLNNSGRTNIWQNAFRIPPPPRASVCKPPGSGKLPRHPHRLDSTTARVNNHPFSIPHLIAHPIPGRPGALTLLPHRLAALSDLWGHLKTPAAFTMESSSLPVGSTAAVGPKPAAGVDEESLRAIRLASHSLGAKSPTVSLSYRVSLTVNAKSTSDTGKAKGGTEQKLILDDACGTVEPGQV